MTQVLDRAGVPYDFTPSLEDAVTRTVASAAPRDLVLLLGAQGMDRGAEIARRVLGSTGRTARETAAGD